MPRSSLRARKLIYGVAHNDASYKVRSRGIVCPFFCRWYNMLTRCYRRKDVTNPTYNGCEVCEQWLTFSNFKSWMEDQDWEGKELDKDLLGPGNMYSPEFCLFIEAGLNKVFKESVIESYPLGVSYKQKSSDMNNELKNCYSARSHRGNKRYWLGVFSDTLSAHRAWQKDKIQTLKSYSFLIKDERVKMAIENITKRLERDYNSGKITKYIIRERK